MFDFSQVENQEIARRVKKEATQFMAWCHYGCQGVDKTEQDVKDAVHRLLDSGFMARSFDTEIVYIPLAKSMLGDRIPLHSAISYPMGRTTVTQKLRDLDRAWQIGVRDTCLCIDWQALFSGRYADLETEAAEIMKRFGDAFIKLAFTIPSTLMSPTETLCVMRALDSAGVVSVKVNPGAKLGVSFEEVAFIKRHFPNRFDVHPSGNIRSLGEVERYLEMGCDNIHTISSLDITLDFINKRLLKYGGMLA